MTHTLSDLPVGRYTVISVSENGPSDESKRDFLLRCPLFGFSPGAHVEILKKRSGAIIVRTPFGRFALGSALASLVCVSKEETL